MASSFMEKGVDAVAGPLSLLPISVTLSLGLNSTLDWRGEKKKTRRQKRTKQQKQTNRSSTVARQTAQEREVRRDGIPSLHGQKKEGGRGKRNRRWGERKKRGSRGKQDRQ